MKRLGLTARRLTISALPIAAMLAASPVLAQTSDQAPATLSAAPLMSQDKPGTESWTYINPRAVFPNYRNVIVDPTMVYNGPDAQFGDISPADRAKYAGIFTEALRREVGKSFPVPANVGAGTLRIRLTLLGVQKTMGGVATATRVTPLGFGLSAAKSLLGKGGTFTGSALFAVEAVDGKSGEVLLTAVRRRTPDPLDIPATLSTTETVKAVARDFANNARMRLLTMTGK